ncbi:MAG: hypothetical protein V3S29_00075 [bacterium]
MSDTAPAMHPPEALRTLAERGVVLPDPALVAVGREVPLQNLAAGATLYPFTRLHGALTTIAAGAKIGPGGAATLQNAQIGPGAEIGTLGPVTLREVACGAGTVLGCGVAEESVMLGREAGGSGFNTGYGFRLRKGSLYEEDANSAQQTDTKMTVLFPWVTLGSNVNWCDLLMAGGSGPRVGEFSELGSGTIHFNFTPRGDKATASLFGDVVDGVWLDRPRLFLGGNGSMVGPLTARYGAVSGAGRRFVRALAAGLNSGEADPPRGDLELEIYGSVKRVFDSQVVFVAELAALDAYYGQARALLAGGDPELGTLYQRGRAVVAVNIAERIAQLAGLAGRMERSAALLEGRAPADPRIAQHRALLQSWPAIETELRGYRDRHAEMPALLRRGLEDGLANHGRVYTRVIRALPPRARAAGRDWLKKIRDAVAAPRLLAAVPPLD